MGSHKKDSARSKKESRITVDLKLEVPQSILRTSYHTLDEEDATRAESVNARRDDKYPLQITGVAWNSTQSSLASFAIALGSTNKEDNITKGAILQWDLDFTNKNDDELPSYELEVTSHLTCISAHEEKNNVYCVGSSYGEVMIIDFSVKDGENHVVTSSKIGPYTHSEPISAVCWFRTNAESDPACCSVGIDGKIIIWGPSLSYPVRVIPLRKDTISIMGSAMSVRGSTRLLSGSIVVGTAGGSVIVYDIEQPKKHAIRIPGCDMKWSANALTMISRMDEKDLEDAVKKIENRAKHKKRKGVDCVAVLDSKLPFDALFPLQNRHCTLELSHAGQVAVVGVNPFYSNIFLSAGMDGSIKLYDASLKCCVLEFYLPSLNPSDICSLPVIDAKFSPTRETVIVVASEKGSIFVWDVSESIDFPTEQFKIPGCKEDNEISSITFGDTQGSLLVVADTSGKVHLLRLPEALCRPCASTENLERIAGLK